LAVVRSCILKVSDTIRRCPASCPLSTNTLDIIDVKNKLFENSKCCRAWVKIEESPNYSNNCRCVPCFSAFHSIPKALREIPRKSSTVDPLWFPKNASLVALESSKTCWRRTLLHLKLMLKYRFDGDDVDIDEVYMRYQLVCWGLWW